jgi:hypothetical protein
VTEDLRTSGPGAVEPDDRDPAARLAAHAQIARLADGLLPALVARLGTTGLGELEVREGSWRVRLRMPPGPRPPQPATARRGSRAGSGLPGGPARPGAGSAPAESGFIIGPDIGPGPAEASAATPFGGRPGADGRTSPRLVASAPAVGFDQPRAGLAPGSRVRAGERLGVVDVLGVPQDVLAPEAGILGAALVEPGEPVEYGQEIVVIEPLPAAGPSAGAGDSSPAGGVAPALPEGTR